MISPRVDQQPFLRLDLKAENRQSRVAAANGDIIFGRDLLHLPIHIERQKRA
jgi:hypothetical protein